MREVETYLKHWCKHPASEVGSRVAELLEELDGLHHFEESLMKKVEWDHPFYIKMRLRGSLSTFDFDVMTRLVFLAHDHCIRVEIQSCNAQYLTLLFHPRVREGEMSQRHPTLEQAVESWRSRHPTRELATREVAHG